MYMYLVEKLVVESPGVNVNISRGQGLSILEGDGAPPLAELGV